MSSAFYTPIASKAIIVERESSMRLYWFWPLAAIMFVLSTYIIWQGHPSVALAMVFFAIVPLTALVWLELKGRLEAPMTLMSWHGGRLFLFENGKHVRTLRSNQIKHIELTQARSSAYLLLHTEGEILEQKFNRLGRGQRLQIQRIVRCLEAEVTYKRSFGELPDDLASIAHEIDAH